MQETQETQAQSLGGDDPLEKEVAFTPVFLTGKFHGQRSLVGYSPWDHKESDMTKQLSLVTNAVASKTEKVPPLWNYILLGGQ